MGTIYPDSSNLNPSLEEFNDFVNNLGLSFGLNSPLNVGGLVSEHELPPGVSQRNGTRGSVSRLSVDPVQTGQMPTLLPIPLNPWCTLPSSRRVPRFKWLAANVALIRSSGSCIHTTPKDQRAAKSRHDPGAHSFSTFAPCIHVTLSRIIDSVSKCLLRWCVSSYAFHTLRFL